MVKGKVFTKHRTRFTFVLADQLSLRAINVLNGVILAKLLLPHGYGLYRLVFTIVGVFFTIFTFGIDLAAYHFVAKFRGTQFERDAQFTSFLYRLFSGCIAYLLILIIAPFFSSIYKQDLSYFIRLAAISLIIIPFTDFHASIIAHERFEFSFLVTILSKVLMLVASVGLLLRGWGINGAILGYILSFCLNAILIITSTRIRGRFSKNLFVQMIQYAAPLWIVTLSEFMYKQFHIILLGIYVKPEVISFFSLASLVSSTIIFVVGALTRLYSPNLSKLWGHRNEHQIIKIYKRGLRLSILLSIYTAMGILIFIEPVLSLALEEYLPSLQYVFPLVSLYIVEGIFIMNPLILRVTEKTKSILLLSFVTFGISVPLYIITIPVYGPYGIILALVATLIIKIPLSQYFISSFLKTDMRKKLSSFLLDFILTILLLLVAMLMINLPLLASFPARIIFFGCLSFIFSILFKKRFETKR